MHSNHDGSTPDYAARVTNDVITQALGVPKQPELFK